MVQITPLTEPEDFPLVARMCRDLIEHGFPWTWTTKAVAEKAESFVLAKAGDRLVGFVASHPEEPFGHLDLIAVRPDFRRKGVGRRLVEYVEEVAKGAGQERVVLETLRSAKFFEALGYTKIGVLPGVYYGHDGYVYGKEL